MTVRQDLTDANSRIGRRIIDGAAKLAQVAFLNLGDWRDVDAERYLSLIKDPLTSLKNEGAKSTVAFYKAMADLDGEKFSAPTITKNSLATSVLRNGVAEDVVWKRPFVTMRTALAQGKSVKESIELGASRAGYLASTEVQLARRGAGLQARSKNDRIVGYIRTLTGFENCALCYVASTQRYTRGDLLPIHPACDCGEMPIYGTVDPGQVIDEMRLSKTHQAIEERFGISDPGAREPDYRKILIANHGEMGPTLTVRGQNFTGPNNLDLVGTTVKKNPEIVAEAQEQIAELTGIDETSDVFGFSRVSNEKPAIFKNGKFDPDIDQAIYEYSGREYRPINKGLRDGFDSFDPEDVEYLQERIANLDKAFEVSVLTENQTLYRATSSRVFGTRPIEELQALVGQTIEDKGFVSTSISDKYLKGGFDTALLDAEQRARQVAFIIDAPKGTKALDLTALDVSANPQEAEILLKRGTKFKVKKIELRDIGMGRTKRFVELEVLPNE